MKIRGREVSFSWLKPPPMPEDGNMALYDHLRELRYRLVVSVLAVVVGMALCAFFYPTLYNLLEAPWLTAKADLAETRPDLDLRLINAGITSPFTLALKVVGLAGLIISAPVWLLQVWSFIVPGLLAKEKKWAMVFVGLATPLFLAGIVTGYLIMPKGIGVLISFTPETSEVVNQLALEDFLGFLMRVMLVFGISYLIPLVLLLLNFLGIVKGAHLKKFRPAIIFGSFVFAAVATPSTDPFSMLALAMPLAVLCMITEAIAHVHDRRKRAKGDDPIENDVVLQAMYAEDERKAKERAELEESGELAPDRDDVTKALEAGKS